MENRKNIFPIRYPENLCNINDINFTPREIDVMACLISARGTSKISSFLSIAPKTVVNHIHNLMQKIGCNSREGIIDFIEKSNNQLSLRTHYSHLGHQLNFKKALKKIARLLPHPLSCSLIYGKEHENNDGFIKDLKADLELVGFKVHIKVKDNETSLIKELGGEHYSLYIMPRNLEAYSIAEEALDKYFFLCMEQEDLGILKNYSGKQCIDCTETADYYLIVFKILKSLLPAMKIDQIIAEFKQQCESADEAPKSDNSEESVKLTKQGYSFPFSKGLQKKWVFLIGLIIVTSTLGAVLLNNKGAEKGPSIRSELIIPHHNVLLNRPDIMAELDKKLREKEGIKTVAVIGPGGSGKTTLTRQYAHQQKEKIIWEINAETQESLKNSFGKLAEKLAITDKDKEEFRNIQDIRDVVTREEKILDFAKDLLKFYSNWLLIYDNVENFQEITHYFPQDSKIWGDGKIIITTRNANIQNNSQIDCMISLGELRKEQKLDLFTQIMMTGSNPPFAFREQGEKATFLESIPPFPLDISVAAYYIKTTNISYASYLERLNQQDEEFAGVQQNLLKEAGAYLKTRYSIITLALENIIQNHKDLSDLFLFISLLDSQNIPRDFLDRYKDKAIVDNFIYQLKKHSLITNEIFPATSESAFSLHRSAQEITLAYLRKKLNLDDNKQTVELMGSFLENYINNTIENFDFPRMEFLTTHCEAFLSHDNVLTDFTRGAVGLQMAGLYGLQAIPNKTRSILKRTLEILYKNPVENQAKIAYALYILGVTYWDLGNYEKSKALYEQSIRIYNHHLSENQLRLARNFGSLAHVTRTLGELDKSKKLCEHALAIYSQHYPKNHLRIAWILSFLGATYYELGYYEKALEALNRSLTIYNEAFSCNHIGIARVESFLGLVYWKLRNYEKAIYCTEKGINASETAFPALSNNFYGLSWTRTNLGNMYKDLGNYKKAKDLLQQGLIFREKFYGKEHFETAKILRDLGSVYLLENNIDKADAFFQRSLSIFQKTNHVEIYTILESLAELYLKKSLLARQNDPRQVQYFKNQAIDYLKQALAVVTTRLSVDSPHRIPIEAKLKDLQE